MLGLQSAYAENWLVAFRQLAQQLPDSAVLVTAIASAMAVGAPSLLKGTIPAEIPGVNTIVGIGTRALAMLLLRYLNQGSETSRQRVERASRVANISVFDMPALIDRVLGYSRRRGAEQRPTLQDLRSARRYDDALLIDTIQRMKRNEDELSAIDAVIDAPENNMTDADKASVKRSLRALEAHQRPNTISLDGIEMKALKDRGYVETFLRLQVLDSRRGAAQSRDTFQIGSGGRSFFAGIVASGVQKLQAELAATIKDLTLAWKFDVEPYASPLVRSGAGARTLTDALTGRWVGRRRQRTWPDTNALIATLLYIAQRVRDSLATLMTEPSTVPPVIRAGNVRRRLPHILRTSNAAGMSFVLEQNTGVLVQADAGLANSLTDGLRNIVTSSVGTIRVVRQAIDQFLESEGAVRERMRLVMYVDDVAFVGLVAIPQRGSGSATPPLNISVGIRTRACYAARFPQEMVDALEGHAQHPRLAEALAVAWLSGSDSKPLRDSGADAALRFGLDATHEGELLASVLVDLALDDVVQRISSTTLTKAPSREQLMRTSLQYAAALLQRAGATAHGPFVEAFGMRIEPHDAYYSCYPGGEALLRVLHETAVWRGWKAPWTQRTPYNRREGRGDRFAVLDASLSAVPVGVDSLLRVLRMLPHVRVPATASLADAPYLSAQTVQWHTAHDLPMVLPDGRQAPSDARGATWNCAWLTLAAQAEASVDAAHRVSVLASGLTPHLHAQAEQSLLRESALARPVLGLVVRVDPANGPRVARDGLRMIDDVLARVGDPRAEPLQPKVPLWPEEGSKLDTRRAECRERLLVRLATLRFNVGDLAREPALSTDLLNRFAGLNLARVDYLCAFGNAFGAEPSATVGRHFEDVKIYSALLAHVATDAPPERVPTIELRRQAEEEGVHPLLLRMHSAGKRPVLDARLVRMPVAVQSLDESTTQPRTLRAFWAAAQTASELPSLHCVGVDAASCLLHNVERVTQALLVMVGRGYTGESALLLTPPPPPVVTRVHEMPLPLEGPQLTGARRNVYILVLTLTGGGPLGGMEALAALVHPTDEAAQADYVARMRDDARFVPGDDDAQRAYVEALLEEVDGVETEALASAIATRLGNATPNPPLQEQVRSYYDRIKSPPSPYASVNARLGVANRFLEMWTYLDAQLAKERAQTELGNVYAVKVHPNPTQPFACVCAHFFSASGERCTARRGQRGTRARDPPLADRVHRGTRRRRHSGHLGADTPRRPCDVADERRTGAGAGVGRAV